MYNWGMAKKNKNKTGKSKKKFDYKQVVKPKYIIVIILGLVLVFFGVRFWSQAAQAEAQKKELLAQKVELEKIADKIVEKNPPTERSSSESCRYQSRKFEKGDLYCKVTVELNYKDIDFPTANLIKDQSSQSFDGGKVFDYTKPGIKVDFFDENNIEDTDYLVQDFNSPHLSKDCILSYGYPYPVVMENDLRISLACNIKSLSEHFPVIK